MRHISLTNKIITILKESNKPLSTHEIQDAIPQRQRQSMNVLGNVLSKNPHIRKVGMTQSGGFLGMYEVSLWAFSGIPDHKMKTSKRFRLWECRRCSNISIKLSTRRHQNECEYCCSKNHSVHSYLW